MSVEPNTQAVRLPAPAAPEPAPADAPTQVEAPGLRAVLAGPLVAIASMVTALLVVDAAGVPLRDPDHVAGRRLLIVFALVGLLVVVDVAVRAARGTGRVIPTRAAFARVRREQWTAGRGLVVALALMSFYVTYLAYRNLKSVVPLIRPNTLFDRDLADWDRALFFGHDPADVLHAALGTGLASQVLSLAYGMFFVFIPATLAFAIVFSPQLRAGLFYVTAQSLNWLLGAGSYFLLPALGPVYYEPRVFEKLEPTGITRLQEILIDQRTHFLADPVAGNAQSIAAFSSLHISIFFTGVLTVHLLGLGRRMKLAAWLLLAATALATIHLGWHYVVDDIAGAVLALAAVALAAVLTGFDPRAERRAAAARGSAA